MVAKIKCTLDPLRLDYLIVPARGGIYLKTIHSAKHEGLFCFILVGLNINQIQEGHLSRFYKPLHSIFAMILMILARTTSRDIAKLVLTNHTSILNYATAS